MGREKVGAATRTMFNNVNPWGAKAGKALLSYPETGRSPGLPASTLINHGIQMALGRCDLGLHSLFNQDNFQKRLTAKSYMPVAFRKYGGISSSSPKGF